MQATCLQSHDRLETARSVIEAKFSAAGDLIGQSLEAQAQLIASLDALEAALDPTDMSIAVADLLEMSIRLRSLDQAINGRRARIHALKTQTNALSKHVTEMEGSLRYLHVFAVNIKVTAAGTQNGADVFGRFAQDMQQDILAGSGELEEFATRLGQLDDRIASAERQQADLESNAARVLASLPDQLADDARAIGRYNEQVFSLSAQVRERARESEGRTATALSALQIGDMTRQRVEHVQGGLTLLAEHAGEAQEIHDARAIAWPVLTVLAAQMHAIDADFSAEVRRLSAQIHEIGVSGAEIINLLGAIRTPPGQSGGNAIRSLERSLGDALELITAMEDAHRHAEALEDEARRSVDDLVARVSDIQRLNESVQFIAINTTLRASRMGEGGKPLHVIAQEVRLHADQMESVARLALAAVGSLGGASEDDAASLDLETLTAALNGAAGRLRKAAGLIETEISDGCRRAESVVATLQSAARTLDLEANVGAVLRDVAERLVPQAEPATPASGAASSAIEDILNALARSYTMARERTVHEVAVGAAQAKAA